MNYIAAEKVYFNIKNVSLVILHCLIEKLVDVDKIQTQFIWISLASHVR